MTHHKTLDVLEVQTPCTADLPPMGAAERSQFCSHCWREVYNLSAMPADEAERLICASGGNLCVQFDRGRDGKIITLDYAPAEPIRVNWKPWAFMSAAAAALIALVAQPTLTKVRGGVRCLPTPPGSQAAGGAATHPEAASSGDATNNGTAAETLSNSAPH